MCWCAPRGVNFVLSIDVLCCVECSFVFYLPNDCCISNLRFSCPLPCGDVVCCDSVYVFVHVVSCCVFVLQQ